VKAQVRERTQAAKEAVTQATPKSVGAGGEQIGSAVRTRPGPFGGRGAQPAQPLSVIAAVPGGVVAQWPSSQ
jgi:hypothetical protein